MGYPINTSNINNSNYNLPNFQAPAPGYMSIPPWTIFKETTVFHQPPEKIAATMDDIVISMLEQVDETIYLGYLEDLISFGPRVTGSDACEAAAEYLYHQFDNMGLSVRYHFWSNGKNVEATINGTDESNDEIYIICAHYDTVTSSPGADDDGSGSVAVLMAAFVMSQYQYKFNHTVKFVAFSGEEQGLLGSQAYAAEAAEEGWNIIGVLNADMISYAETTSDGNKLIVFQNDASEWLYNYTHDISIEYADYIHLTLYDGGFTWGSDHHSFWVEGYDALFYYEYRTTPYYHTSQDTIEHINATYAMKNIRLILATLAELSEVSIRNNPPLKPILTGSANGTINQAYNLSIVTTEPDGEDVFYFIDWDDGHIDEWIGPYTSGETVKIVHQWNKKGTYTVKAKAKDIYDTESDWGTISVIMPSEYTFSVRDLLQNLLLILSNKFPIFHYWMKN